MNCIYCNKLIIPKIKIRNLFKRELDILCEYCTKKLDVDIELSILPIDYNVIYGFRIFDKSDYSRQIFYTKQIHTIYGFVDKMFDDYIILHFENEKNLFDEFSDIENVSKITSNIIIIYH